MTLQEDMDAAHEAQARIAVVGLLQIATNDTMLLTCSNHQCSYECTVGGIIAGTNGFSTGSECPACINRVKAQATEAAKVIYPDQPEQIAPPAPPTTTEEILAERGATHGEFASNARVIQGMKRIAATGDTYRQLSDVQREAIDMCLHKIGRAVNGDVNEPDHFKDMAGYSTLVVKDLALVGNQVIDHCNMVVPTPEPTAPGVGTAKAKTHTPKRPFVVALDVHGVLLDIVSTAQKHCRIKVEPAKSYDFLANPKLTAAFFNVPYVSPDFWMNFEIYPWAHELVNLVERYADAWFFYSDCTLLAAIPNVSRWLAHQFDDCKAVLYADPTHNKLQGRHFDLLIDDHPDLYLKDSRVITWPQMYNGAGDHNHDKTQLESQQHMFLDIVEDALRQMKRDHNSNNSN